MASRDRKNADERGDSTSTPSERRSDSQAALAPPRQTFRPGQNRQPPSRSMGQSPVTRPASADRDNRVQVHPTDPLSGRAATTHREDRSQAPQSSARSLDSLPAMTTHAQERPQVPRGASAKPQKSRSAGPIGPFPTPSSQSSASGCANLPNVRPSIRVEISTLQEQKQPRLREIPRASDDNRQGPPVIAGVKRSVSRETKHVRSTGASSRQALLPGSIKAQNVHPATGGESSNSRESAQDPSFASTGEQFWPKSVRGGEPRMPGPNRSGQARAPAGKFGIGIETEFLLKALRPEHRAGSMCEFAKLVANNHNKLVGLPHPRMYENARTCPPKRTSLDKWVLGKDPTMERKCEPWGVEMATPLFVAFRGSTWRSHVQATWQYLQRYYEITGDVHCATHVHVSVEGGYSLEEVKRIAQAVIHFEPAFDALVPPQRRGGECEYAKNSWLDSDHLALENRNREQSIAYIDKITDFYSLLSVMNPDNEKNYAWNFHSIPKYSTIEFRKPQASTTVDEVLSWAELEMSFIQAAVRFGSATRLKKVPSTVGGLRWFLKQSGIPGLNEHERLQWFWKGKDDNAFVETLPLRLYLSPDEEEVLKAMREIDEKKILSLAKTAREPYWR